MASDLSAGSPYRPLDIARCSADADNVLQCFQQMVAAINYAHSMSIAHHSLRLSSFIVDADTRTVKLRGFAYPNAGALSPFTPPCCGNPFAGDIFALGVILRLMPGSKRHTGPHLTTLIDAMTSAEPNARPTARQVAEKLSHLLEGSHEGDEQAGLENLVVELPRAIVSPDFDTVLKIATLLAAGPDDIDQRLFDGDECTLVLYELIRHRRSPTDQSTALRSALEAHLKQLVAQGRLALPTCAAATAIRPVRQKRRGSDPHPTFERHPIIPCFTDLDDPPGPGSCCFPFARWRKQYRAHASITLSNT